MDERIRRIVLQQPIPERLVRKLARVPLATDQPPHRIARSLQYGATPGDPSSLTPKLRRTLELLCEGYRDREIARETGYAYDTVRDHVQALCAVLGARNRSHLAALGALWLREEG